MRISRDIDLYKYSTMRTHSIGDIMYTPENVEELKGLIHKLHGDCYFIGGGSNVVFCSRVHIPIVNLMELNHNLQLNADGTVVAGCSVRIQKLINFGCEHSLGGFEYLYSLPASVGGIVYMNAGRGKSFHQQISDWLESVEYLDLNDMEVKTMKVEKALWGYRCSPFQKMKAVILSAKFRMQQSTKERIAANIQKRKEIALSTQEGNKPSCGSVFHTYNKYLMYLLRGRRVAGACYSKKTLNWISNDREGTSDDIIALIQKAHRLHQLFFQHCELEIKIVK